MQVQEVNVSSINDSLKSGIIRLVHRTTSIDVKYHRGSTDTLIVLFHGAVNRNKRAIPYFQSHFPDLKQHHQISIFDPTLCLGDDILSGWYIGGSSLPLQSDLHDILCKISEVLGLKRRIYVGGSSGGFAALYYSWKDKGSACVTVNPQTNLRSYLKSAIRPFLSSAWPSVSSIDDLENHAVIDLSKIYSASFENTVVYVQSSGDNRHLSSQLKAFCQTGLKHSDRFILHCDYWGIPGHSGSVPISAYYPWVASLAAVNSFEKSKVMDVYHLLQINTKLAPAREYLSRGQISEADRKMSAYLRDLQINSSD